MPAAYAHYVFGKKVYQKLPEKERERICGNLDAFLLGLHGPDLLFYYYPLGKNRVNQLGKRLHREIAADFFEKGRANYRSDDDPALRAYLYGFLCHFILDSECHPYISFYMEEKQLGHMEIEKELDRYLMKGDGLDPLRDAPIHHLISRRHTREQIARMFDGVSPRQAGVCIYSFRQVQRFFVCENPGKGMALRTILSAAGQSRGLAGLIMDSRENRNCMESNRFLTERLERAVPCAVREIEKYIDALDSGDALSERLNRTYE